MIHLNGDLLRGDVYAHESTEELIKMHSMLGRISCCDCGIRIEDHSQTADGDFVCNESAHTFTHFQAVSAALKARSASQSQQHAFAA
jgi:hypothetical protein